MAGTHSIQIRQMTLEDLDVGMRLKQLAGWNQTDADWQRFLALAPDGCFIAESAGRPVGTITTCVFDRVAWIGMMLVDPAHRRRGIATRLMHEALDQLDRTGVLSVRLDATDMGRPLYERLGFEAQYRVTRYGGTAERPTGSQVFIRPAGGEHRSRKAILQLDREAVATNRHRLLERLLAEFPGEVRIAEQEGEAVGYVVSRPGVHARQIGPLVASLPGAGRSLLADALGRHLGQAVFVDVPESNLPARQAVSDAGLTVLREFTRMCRGAPSVERVEWLWASSGPEKG